WISRGSSRRRTDWPTANFSETIGSLTSAARSRQDQLARHPAQVHLELEPLDRRPAREPANAVDGGGPGDAQDLLEHQRVDRLGGVDVDRGHPGPVAAERGQALLHG